jgi:hypothetical protein
MDGLLDKMLVDVVLEILAISTSTTGLCMSINSSGVVNFPFGPTAPTATVGTNTTQVATTAFVTSNYYTQTSSDTRYLPWCGGRMSACRWVSY